MASVRNGRTGRHRGPAPGGRGRPRRKPVGAGLARFSLCLPRAT